LIVTQILSGRCKHRSVLRAQPKRPGEEPRFGVDVDVFEQEKTPEIAGDG
jgi:hypothetical protein